MTVMSRLNEEFQNAMSNVPSVVSVLKYPTCNVSLGSIYCSENFERVGLS